MDKYILMISEKPQAAMKISDALATSKVIKKEEGGTYWFEFERNGVKHVCVPAVGHLLVLDTANSKGWNYPVFDVEWVPSFSKKGSEFSRNYFKNMEELAKRASEFIVCCDYDIEGEVIGYNILRFICNKKDAKRMKFSTLTRDELIESYENMMKHLDFGQAEAGLTRHHLDFIWGINATRALTLALKSALKKGFAIVSTGRVQGPTLSIITQREMEIKKFKPVPFWQLELYFLINGSVILALHEKDKIWNKKEAEKVFNESKGKDAVIKDIQKRKYRVSPPVPFDTTTLQTESYRCFGYSPTQTLSIAESLYTQGFISYPRTGSQKLPDKIGYKKILEDLAKIKLFEKGVKSLLAKKELKPNEGKKTDPAHPAIYPTSQIPDFDKLTSQQKRLYELVVRRFLSVFGDPALRESMKVILDVNKNNFVVTGQRTLELGWTQFYGKFATMKEQMLPELKIGETLKVKELKMVDKETQPPGHYSQASIIKRMEEKNLGTKATRAQILQTLYDRGYVVGKSIEVTNFGEHVIEVLNEYCPRILSEELTRKFEEEMELVSEGKKKREKIIEEAEVILKDLLEDFKKNEDKIGKGLSKAYIAFKDKQRHVGKCPQCGKDLIVIRSRRTGKRFVGCSGYKDGCRFSTPLPQAGMITTTDKTCKECEYPVIMVKFKGKRPFFSCINMKCPTKEKYKKSKEAKEKKKIDKKLPKSKEKERPKG